MLVERAEKHLKRPAYRESQGFGKAAVLTVVRLCAAVSFCMRRAVCGEKRGESSVRQDDVGHAETFSRG